MRLIIFACVSICSLAQNYYVNSGGPQFTEPNGTAWGTDTQSGLTLVGGASVSTGFSNGESPVYQTAIQGTFSGGVAQPFTYTFTANPGTYNVTLKFEEFYFQSSGSRVFSVTDQSGKVVIPAFDIVSQSGGIRSPIDTTIQVTSCTGSLGLTFSPLSGEPPQVNAIAAVFVNGNACPPTVVSSCRALSSGNYVVPGNLSSSGDCLTATGVDNVVLDCGGHTVSSTTDGNHAILFLGVNGGTIKNCRVTVPVNNTTTPVAIGVGSDGGSVNTPSNNVTLSNNNVVFGDVITNGDSNEISGSTITSGLRALGNNTYIHDNDIEAPTNGLPSSSLTVSAQNRDQDVPHNVRIVRNTVNNNFSSGGYTGSNAVIAGCDGCTISTNYMTDSRGWGIEWQGLISNSSVVQNVLISAAKGGIGGSSNPSMDCNEIAHNTVSMSSWYNNDSVAKSLAPIFSFVSSPNPTWFWWLDSIYFRNNVFHDNRFFTELTGQELAAESINFDFSAIPSSRLITSGAPCTVGTTSINGNLFYSNDFGYSTIAAAATNTMYLTGQPRASIIDQGGNRCRGNTWSVSYPNGSDNGPMAPIHCGSGIQIFTNDPLSGNVNVPYSATFYVEGGRTFPANYTVTAGSAPNGLAWNKVNNYTYTLSGIPVAESITAFTVSASDSYSNSASQTFSIAISPQDLHCDGSKGAGSADQSAAAANVKFVQCVYSDPAFQGTPTASLVGLPINYSSAATSQSVSWAGWFYFSGGYYTLPLTYCGTEQVSIDGTQLCQRYSSTGASSSCGVNLTQGNHLLSLSFFVLGPSDCTATPTAKLTSVY